MAKDYLQFLRNETIFEDKKTAIQGLVNKLNSVRANGSPLIATYKDGEDGIVSILFGITYGDGKNYQIFEGSKINSAGDLEIPDSILNEIKNQISLVVGGASDDYNTLKKLEDLINGLKTELDSTQVGSGLNTDGTYSANTDSNYISNASSLKDADSKLDAEIKKNADAIDTINSEITEIKGYATEVASGDGIEVSKEESGHTTTVSVKKDGSSEKYLTVGPKGVKVSGIDEAINSSKTEIGKYTVNAKAISSNPVLNGGDVKLDGYEKSTGETIAIASGDTVNSAIGKLEKSIDDTNAKIAEVEENAIKVVSGNGINVVTDDTGHTATVSVKIDSSTEPYLTVGAEGLKVTGIAEAINSSKTEIGNHTVNTKPISSNPVLNGGDVKLDGYVRSELENSGLTIDASNTVNVAIGKLEKAIIDNEEACSKAFDTVKTSVGLSDTLEYVAPELSNYLGSANSVKEADSKLDAEIKKNADEILRINSALGTIGNYKVNSKAISGNPIVNGEDIKLDNYTKSVESGETLVIASGDTVNSAIGKLEKSIEDNKVSVLATTGDSETAVMSQKAVTTETELVRYLKTKTTVETLQNLPTDYYLILANISGTSASLTVKGTMKDMQEIHIIVHNTNPKEMITIVLPSSSNYINTTETSVSVLPNEYCEINMISDGTNTYIRAI